MNMNAFQAFCDYESIAGDPDVFGEEFNSRFIGEIDVEDYLRAEIEDMDIVPESILPYIDYDMMAKDRLSENGNLVQMGKYLFRAA